MGVYGENFRYQSVDSGTQCVTWLEETSLLGGYGLKVQNLWAIGCICLSGGYILANVVEANYVISVELKSSYN